MGVLGVVFIIPTGQATLQTKKSLMFTPQEVNSILSKRYQENQTECLKQQGCLICQGILYHTSQLWTVWLGEEAITATLSSSFGKDLKVLRVKPTEVHLLWKYKNEEHRFTLRPNQFYDARLRQVKSFYE